MHFFFFFFSKTMLRKCEVCYSLKLPMKVIDRTKAVTQHFLENSFKKLSKKKENKNRKIRKTQNYMFSKCLLRHDVVRVFIVPCASFCTGHFVMGPLNITNLHCLQHSLFEHLFHLYYTELVGNVLGTFF